MVYPNTVANTATNLEVQPQFYGLKDVSIILGLSKATVSTSIKAGKIPCIRVSKYPLIPRKWVDQQREAALASVGDKQ